jgi:hypothetical protein
VAVVAGGSHKGEPHDSKAESQQLKSAAADTNGSSYY